MEHAHIVHSLGSVDFPSYPYHHVRPCDLWCQKWDVTKTVSTIHVKPTVGCLSLYPQRGKSEVQVGQRHAITQEAS